jgi:hypothetical protein
MPTGNTPLSISGFWAWATDSEADAKAALALASLLREEVALLCAVTESYGWEAAQALALGMSPDIALLLDQETRFLAVFCDTTKRLYRPPSEFIGKRIDEVFDGELLDKFKWVHSAPGPRGSISYEIAIAGEILPFVAESNRLPSGGSVVLIRALCDVA